MEISTSYQKKKKKKKKKKRKKAHLYATLKRGSLQKEGHTKTEG